MGAGAAACGRGCGGGPLDEDDGVEETGGAADGGRDQPGPVVVDKTGAAVSLVVTSRECVLIGGATGRTGAGLPDLTTGTWFDDVVADPEEDEFFCKNFLLMLTEVNFFGCGAANDESDAGRAS